MGLWDGQRAVIFGVANDRSIAWAISEAFHAEGAELAFTYAGEVLEKRVRPLAEGIGAKIILPCDVTKDEEIEKVFATLKQEWGSLDILIHAIAFANKEDLANPYVQTSRQGFHLAMDVSAYSFVALARHAAPLMEGRKASMLTLTYMGSEKVIPNYNVMGVAKAALDRLLSASQSEFAETREFLRDALSQCRWMVLPLSANPSAPAYRNTSRPNSSGTRSRADAQSFRRTSTIPKPSR